MKNWYDEHVLPRVIEVACGADDVAEQRRRVVPLAAGRVLEVGVGTGHNLAFYDRDRVDVLWAVEPSAAMRERARPRVAASGLEVRWLDRSGDDIPLDDDSVDSVVVTYTLCTIPDWRAALAQLHRVLAPGGVLMFCEHGEAPDPDVQRWQRRLNPVWSAIAGGCNLDRPIVAGLEEAGFEVEWSESAYRGFPRAASYTTRGVART